MTAKQEAKLNMYHAVVTFCDDNTAIVTTVPAFETALTAAKTKLAAIVTTAQLEAQVIAGIAMDKEQLRSNLCQQARDMASVVFAYASSINNNELKEQVNFSFTDLRRLRDDQLAPVAQNIYNAANDNLVALATYGITAPILTTYQDSIDDYQAVVPGPRNATSLRATYKANLKTLFADTDTILKLQMDKIAVQFKTTNPDFYNTYVNNRIIVDAGTSSTQVAGTVTSNAGGLPVIGVIITVKNQSYTATTGGDGSYTLKIPVPGLYDIDYTHAAYVPKTISNVQLLLGQSTPLDVVLNFISA